MSFPAKDRILGAAELLDDVFGRLFDQDIRRRSETGSLTVFLFHRFFLEDELASPLGVYPHERVTVSQFEDFICALEDRDFCFVLPRDILAGRHVGKRAVMITVDDGYADNVRVLPILEKYNAKAAFFVCPANTVDKKRFWPDALYIGAKQQGWRARKIRRCQRELTLLPSDEAEHLLKRWFGDDILVPAGTLDRALRVDELKAMVSSPSVEIGYHGYDHTILAPRPDGFVLTQLTRSRRFFERELGCQPKAISYPNGVYSDALLKLCRSFGLKLGITIEARGNHLGMYAPSEGMLALGRFTFSGLRRIGRQINSTQVRWSAMRSLYSLKKSKVSTSQRLRNPPDTAVGEQWYERT